MQTTFSLGAVAQESVGSDAAPATVLQERAEGALDMAADRGEGEGHPVLPGGEQAVRMAPMQDAVGENGGQ